jgi:DNA-binding NarL/FixJ family response regulator
MNTAGHGGKANRNVPIESEVLVVQVVPACGSKGVGSAGRPIRAVVADDSPIILKTLCSFLKEQGDVQIIGAATNGYQAVRRVLELKPDLLFINSRLYGTSGSELTGRLKTRPHSPAVITFTADDPPTCRVAVRAVGPAGFVAKRPTFTHLPAAIRRLFPRAIC